MLVGVALPPPSFPPTGTYALYFINRPNGGLLYTRLYVEELDSYLSTFNIPWLLLSLAPNMTIRANMCSALPLFF